MTKEGEGREGVADKRKERSCRRASWRTRRGGSEVAQEEGVSEKHRVSTARRMQELPCRVRERNSATCGLGSWNVPADLDGSRVGACGSDRGELRKWKQLTVEVSPFEKCK